MKIQPVKDYKVTYPKLENKTGKRATQAVAISLAIALGTALSGCESKPQVYGMMPINEGYNQATEEPLLMGDVPVDYDGVQIMGEVPIDEGD
ncbi:MAG: hypothetical protein Q4C01_05145 [Clostridia bacterium]|nr:hypothetical protein [Clostridia bacterium]